MEFIVEQMVSEGSTLAGRFYFREVFRSDNRQLAVKKMIEISTPVTETRIVRSERHHSV